MTGTVISYLYLLRVPLMLAVIIAALGPLSVGRGAPARAMLEGLFDVYDPTSRVNTFASIAFIALAAFNFVLAAASVTHLVIAHAARRMNVARLPEEWTSCRFEKWGIEFSLVTGSLLLVYLAATLILLWKLATYDPRSSSVLAIFAIASAAVAAVSLVAVVQVIRQWSFGWLEQKAAWLLQWTPDGFLAANGTLLPGHGVAFSLMVLGTIIYVGYGIGVGYCLAQPPGSLPDAVRVFFRLPTLACVLYLLVTLCWSLGGLAFIFDRFRVPTILILSILWTLAAFISSSSDHYYSVSKIQGSRDDLKAAKLFESAPTPIVVATAGGGIQAAAWTARVLTGLMQEADKAGKSEQLASSIRVISSVSGGSVGALYFVSAYNQGKLNVSELEKKVFLPSARSSLAAVAWGLTQPDMFRSVNIVPVLGRLLRRFDRGWATERAWSQGTGQLQVETPLATWRHDAERGHRPAVVFNATVVETGQRFLMATVDPPSLQAVRFRDFYPDHDLDAVTAARLSATFPYVSPAARIDLKVEPDKGVHVADGGYYDNYGVVSAMELIADAAQNGKLNRVLLIEIGGELPGKCEDVLEPGGARRRAALKPKEAAKEGGVEDRGWFFQLKVPVLTMYNSRGAAQRSRNDTELNLLVDALHHKVAIERAQFRFPCDDTALSWHLTEKQVGYVNAAWDLPAIQEQRDKVLRWLSQQ